MVIRKWLITGVASILALILSSGMSCQPSVTTTPPVTTTPTPTQVVIEVEARNFFFLLEDITVSVGTTVTWTNVSINLHTVTSNDDLFNRSLGPGESFSYTFNEPGTYGYHCIPHEDADMGGTVIVE